MSRVIDITDKLSFEEKPKIAIKGKEYEINDNAVTMLKILPKLTKGAGPEEINEFFEMLFSKKDRAEIEKLNLNFKDFQVLVMEAISIATGDEEDPGENPTPDMT